MDAFELIQNGKISRYFRSRKKLIHAGLVSHITQRAVGKDVLFLDEDDYRSMLALMKKLSIKYEIKIYAFCLMPNHMHFLLCPGQDNLHIFFRDLCGIYAKRFNKRYERKGHLFGGSFRQSVVLDDAYLLTASLYIHLNPVRAGLIDDPRRYRFSSCRLYTTKEAPQSFVDSAFVLSLLANNQGKRISIYNELLDRGISVESGNVLEDEQAVERLISFLKKSFPPFLSRQRKRVDKSTLLYSFEPLEEKIADFENLRGLRKPESMKAKKYLVEQLLARGYTATQVADRLAVSRKTVYNILAYRDV